MNEVKTKIRHTNSACPKCNRVYSVLDINKRTWCSRCRKWFMFGGIEIIHHQEESKGSFIMEDGNQVFEVCIANETANIFVVVAKSAKQAEMCCIANHAALIKEGTATAVRAFQRSQTQKV